MYSQITQQKNNTRQQIGNIRTRSRRSYNINIQEPSDELKERRKIYIKRMLEREQAGYMQQRRFDFDHTPSKLPTSVYLFDDSAELKEEDSQLTREELEHKYKQTIRRYCKIFDYSFSIVNIKMTWELSDEEMEFLINEYNRRIDNHRKRLRVIYDITIKRYMKLVDVSEEEKKANIFSFDELFESGMVMNYISSLNYLIRQSC